MMIKNLTKFQKSIAVLLYVLVMIIIELFYRNPLFNKSLELIPNLQSNQSIKAFWKFITIFGTEKVLIPFFLIFFNWYSLSKSYLYLTILIFSVYFDNVLKIIYNNPRPYWVSTAISSENCEGGYGNPSGHAFSSSCVYLTIWHITSDNEFFTKRYWLRVIYLGITLILIFLIMFSRLYLGVHSLNQLLYGFLLGLSLYLLIFLALEFHKLDTKSFIELISSYKILYLSLYICLIVFLLLVYLLVKTDQTYLQFLIFNCPNLDKNRLLETEGFYLGLTIFALIGAHSGFMLLFFLINKYYTKEKVIDYLDCWTDTTLIKSLLRLLLISAILIPCLLPAVLISKNASLVIIFIFKTIVPFYLSLLIAYSFVVFLAVKLSLTNVHFGEICKSIKDSKNEELDKKQEEKTSSIQVRVL